MNHPADKYEPTPEFLARLDGDIEVALRREQHFGIPVYHRSTFATIAGLAAAAVFLLVTGAIVGSSVSYASAEVLDDQRRETATVALAATRALIEVPLELAKAHYNRVLAAGGSASGSDSSLSYAAAQLEALEVSAAKIESFFDASMDNVAASRPALALIPFKRSRHGVEREPANRMRDLLQDFQAARSPQQNIPLTDLSVQAEKSTHTFGAVLGLREAPDGSLVVNDAGRRQLIALDKQLSTPVVLLDSAKGSARSYGPARSPLIPFTGDSLLVLDAGVRNSLLVLDAAGTIVRSLAVLPEVGGSGVYVGPTFTDSRGRLLYKENTSFGVPMAVPLTGLIPRAPRADGIPGGYAGRGSGADGPPSATILVTDRSDSLAIRRMDLDARRVDTIGFVMQPPDVRSVMHPNGGGRVVVIRGKNGDIESARQIINPLYPVDEWAVLSDGTFAIVRGRDYHVDWVFPDGRKSSSPKLPFEWKELSDADKEHLVDSTRAAVDSLDEISFRGQPPGSGLPTFRGDVPEVKGPRKIKYEIVALDSIADYYPPFRLNAVMPDRDGNLWILPRTTSLSKNGELVYDVVNPAHGLVRRVRLPLGRSIAGFGKGGVVYLQFGDVTRGFILEKSIVR